MEDQIEEMLKSQQRKGEKIALANLRHQTQQRAKVDEETLQKLQQITKSTLHDSSLPSEKLVQHYCSLCGRIVLLTNALLENLPSRKTDRAISIEVPQNFIKLNLFKDKIKHINREEGIQLQYRWKCECGIPVGYTALSYDEFEQARLDENYTAFNRKFFYVYPDALVEKMKDSKLISELITYKETVLLHLKRKIKK